MPLCVDSEKCTATLVLQLSVADTLAGTGMAASQFIVTLAGTLTNTGALVSTTVIFCCSVATLPHWSVAVQVLVKMKLPEQLPGVVVSSMSKDT